MAKTKKRKLRFKNGGIVPIFRLAVAVMTVMFLFSTVTFLFERQRLVNKRDELLAKIEEQKKLTVMYEEELSRVGTKEYYEYMARKNLGYIYPDEHILLITEPDSTEE